MNTLRALPFRPHCLFLVLLLLPSGLLDAETAWQTFDDFSTAFNPKCWWVSSGKPQTEAGHLKLDSTVVPTGVYSIEYFDRRPVHFTGLQEKAGRCWSVGLMDGYSLSGVVLRHDAGTTNNPVFSAWGEGKKSVEQDLGPLPAGSKLDFTIDWSGDHFRAEVKRDGRSIMVKDLPPDLVGPDLHVQMNTYNQAILWVDKVEAGPETVVGLELKRKHGRMGIHEIDLGYIPTPWAKSDEPKTLAALHKLRPADLPSHPLAMWVADRLARDTGKMPEKASVETALSGFKRQGAFWMRDDESGLWLSNGKVGVAFLPGVQGAAIASLYNIETGTECIFKAPTPSTPWRLRVLKPSPNGKTWPGLVSAFPKAGDNLSAILDVDGGALAARWEVKQTGSDATISIHWQPVAADKAQFDVDATVTMSSDSPLIRWRANTHKLSGEGYSLVTLMFPLMRGLSAPGESDLFFSWGGRGRGHFYRKLQSWGNELLFYPGGGWTLQYLSLSFGPETTLYLACHDGEANMKQCGVLSDPGTYVTHVAWDPAKLEMPYDVVMGPMKGDWYDAALIYRDWALQQKWCAKGTLAERAAKGTVDRNLLDTDYWIRPNWYGSECWWPAWMDEKEAWKDGPAEVQANLDWFWEGKPPKFFHDAKPEKLNASVHPNLSVWWYAWEKQLFDTEAPVLTARPGVREEFEREAKLGMTVMPYVQFQAWDMEQPTYTEAAKAAAVLQLDGQPIIARFNPKHPLAYLCPSEPPMADAGSKLAEYLSKLGANAMYCDTFPPAPICYADQHGHTLGGGGHWALDADRAILERIKRERGQQFGLMMESSSEPLMDLVDANMSCGFIEPTDAPLWPVIYGGYTVISGAIVHPRGPDDLIGFRLKLGRALIWGSQIGRGCYSPALLEKDKAEFTRRLVYLHAQTRNFLTYGRMVRPPTLSGVAPRVQTDNWNEGATRDKISYDAYEVALWRAVDGQMGLACVNFDDQPHTISFPASGVFSEGERTVSIITADGEKPFRKVNASEEMKLDIPAGDVLMIVFKK